MRGRRDYGNHKPVIDLNTVTMATFAAAEGQTFQLVEAGQSYPLVLVAARPCGSKSPSAARDPFQLDFRGAPGLRAPQRIYHLEHETLGSMDIFLTQHGDGPNGSEFTAIFS